MRRAVVVALMLGGCTWSNALYRARHLAGSAENAERRDRTEEAGALWGQVAVKAESAYARNGTGSKGGEALWLRGRATARLGDCAAAIPLLEDATAHSGGSDWQESLQLDLARCQIQSDNPASALELLLQLEKSTDVEVRREARSLAGRALVRAGRWEEAREALQDDETADARWQRAIAAAHLGRTREALDLIGPRLVARDTAANWPELLTPLAEHGRATVDSLLTPLLAMPMVSVPTRQRWEYAAAAGLAGREPEESVRRLESLIAADSSGPGANSARTALATRAFSAARDSASLVSALARARAVQVGGGSAAFVIRPMVRAGDALLADIASHPRGTSLGDLAFFHQAEIARDSLQAPALSDWLLGEIERRWPDSPYLGKSMLVRIAHTPDSAAAVRERLRRLVSSPYIRYLEGAEGKQFAVLEDSLQRYIDSRRTLRPDDIDGPPQRTGGVTDFE